MKSGMKFQKISGFSVRKEDTSWPPATISSPLLPWKISSPCMKPDIMKAGPKQMVRKLILQELFFIIWAL
jgi:hypothetical protein